MERRLQLTSDRLPVSSPRLWGQVFAYTLANYVLQQTARDNAKYLPKAAETVFKNFYMEDLTEMLTNPT